MNKFGLAVLAIALLGGMLVYGARNGWFESTPHVADEITNNENGEPLQSSMDSTAQRRHQPLSDALNADESAMEDVGGIKRPMRDVARSKMNLVAERAEYLASLPNVGFAPSIPNDTNDSVRSLSRELAENSGSHPAKNQLVPAEAFNEENYLRDKQAYLSQIRPGRIYQTKPVGEDTTPLTNESPRYSEVIQGESVILKVKATPGFPVTFHTQQLGEFNNRLKTISVEADADGVATAVYSAVSGVSGLVRITAASPVHSGQVRYIVDVAVTE